MKKNTRKQIKIILSIPLSGLVYLFVPFRFIVIGCYYISKTFYSQWMRFKLKKSSADITLSYPITIIGGKYITCGKGCFFGPNGLLTAWDKYHGLKYKPSISIGNGVTICGGFHISAVNSIKIGNRVLMGEYVTIVDNGHGNTERSTLETPPGDRILSVSDGVVIEDNVWIGDKVSIVKGVTIGKGAVVGANSVVTKDVPAYSVVSGLPAKVIKQV